MANKKPNFEEDLKKLEETVAALEEGGLSLDDSLKRFEQGINLARRCEKALTEAEKKIEILLKNAEGDLEPRPFGDDAEDNPNAADTAKSDESGSDDADEGLLF